jgi:Probable Zinc-ribbon domain
VDYIVHMTELHDRLIQEWHPKNDKTLDDYAKSSKVKAWWKCLDCSHEWQARIGNRINRESKCPNCKKLRFRGNLNPLWTGHGEISGAQWHNIQKEASEARRNRRYTKPRPPLEFTITIEYVWDLFLKQDRKCALSGKPLTMRGKIDNKQSGNASLDRIDSTKGYIPGNVQWIDKKLQRFKNNLPQEDFITICHEVSAYQNSKLWNGKPPSFQEWTKKSAGKDL